MIAGARYVLVVEDDPVSLRFIGAALAAGGVQVLAAADAAAAERAALAHGPDIALMLVDRHLPDGDGATLLQRLRRCGIAAPAIATSAELDADIDARLRRAGFATTLRKPATVDELRACAGRLLAPSAEVHEKMQGAAAASAADDVPVLDDAGALTAIGGDRTALAALRRLLAAELEGFERDFSGAGVEMGGLDRRLHRLRAACGFCGAVELQLKAAALQQALRGPRGAGRQAVGEFLHACGRTRDAVAKADPLSVVAAP